ARGSGPAEGEEEAGSKDDEPGLIDVLAAAEVAMPRWNETIERFAALLEEIGEVANEAAAHMARSDAQGKGFAGRLVAARALAKRLGPLGEEVLELGTRYASDLVAVDSGILTLIRQVENESPTGEDRQSACELFGSLRG